MRLKDKNQHSKNTVSTIAFAYLDPGRRFILS